MPTKLPKAAPPGRLIGYARVSTEEQGTDPQLDELRAAGCATVLEEHASVLASLAARDPATKPWSWSPGPLSQPQVQTPLPFPARRRVGPPGPVDRPARPRLTVSDGAGRGAELEGTPLHGACAQIRRWRTSTETQKHV